MDDYMERVIDKTVETVVEKTYDDLVHPTLEIIGSRLAQAFKNLPFMQYNMEETEKQIESKMRYVQPCKIVSPEPYVAVPAIQGISYCMDNQNLRNMYANLLASAMNIDIKDSVHPAYVEIIKQLVSDEALLLKYINDNQQIPFVMVTQEHLREQLKTVHEYRNSVLEERVIQNNDKIAEYMENLERLNLIHLESDLSTKKVSEPLLQEIVKEYTPAYPGDRNVIFKDRCALITHFGASFCKVCIPRE